MLILGLHYLIWIVLVLYFIGMLVLGWWSKKGIVDREGFLLGNRQFGVAYMVMHAFGAGTHPGDVAGVTSKTVERGASGIWVSWMWMFGTPFYWLIAPILRRMRCLTVADYFEQRFGRAAAALYVLVAMVGMTVATASILQATTRTVQGMMGKASLSGEATATGAAGATEPATETPASADAPGTEAPAEGAALAERPAWEARGVATEDLQFWWYVGILLVMTAVFVVYSYWGGIVAAVKTDMAQGLMIIALSFVAIPSALALAGGWDRVLEVLSARSGQGDDYLALFDPQYFSLATVIILCINAPFSMLAQPHIMSVSAAGRTEWEGRVGFTYGNILKRVCTMGWCVLALAWLAFLFSQKETVIADAAFGDSIRYLLHPFFQGLMLACVMAAAMSSGDALQVTIAGLFSQNVYRPYIRPDADEAHYVWVTRLAGIVVIIGAVFCAILMRESVVGTILTYFNITAVAGIAIVMGILWRRMNSAGVFASILVGAVVLLATQVVVGWSAPGLGDVGRLAITPVSEERLPDLRKAGRFVVLEERRETEGADAAPAVRQHYAVRWTPEGGTLAWLERHECLAWSSGRVKGLDELELVPTRFSSTTSVLILGILAGILGSLFTKPPRREQTDPFFTKIYTPIGQEDRLDLPLDEAVPPAGRLLTAGGLFIVKPSRQSWVGFLVTLAICLALLGTMWLLLA
jgi:Na+/proline symporter